MSYDGYALPKRVSNLSLLVKTWQSLSTANPSYTIFIISAGLLEMYVGLHLVQCCGWLMQIGQEVSGFISETAMAWYTSHFYLLE